jgi:hypothetical protein
MALFSRYPTDPNLQDFRRAQSAPAGQPHQFTVGFSYGVGIGVTTICAARPRTPESRTTAQRETALRDTPLDDERRARVVPR